LETTGVNTARDRIVEISVLKILPDGSKEEKTVRVNPGMLIPPGATKVHGITDEDVAGLPSFSHYSESLLAFFDGCDLGGFNAIKFDVPLLVAEFSRAGHSFDLEGRNVVDPMVIFHIYEPRDLTAAYQKYCGKTLEDAHTATADVRAAAEIFQAQVQLYPDLPKGMGELHEVCQRRNPDWIDDEGRLIQSEQGPLIAFGKYNGRTLYDLAAEDPDYLQWILSNDFSQEVRNLVADALEQVNSDKFETSRCLIPTITDRKESRGTTGNHDIELRTSIRELPIGQQITNPLFEKYQRVLTIDDVFAIPDEEFLAIPNFDHEALSILRMQACAFIDSEDLWDRTMIPVSVPDLSGDSQDHGDSFFQDSFVPYDPANEAREENDEYGEDEDEDEYEEEDGEDEEDEDEEDEDISRRLEERGDFIQTTSYDYDGGLGDDEESLH
jgi:DNA polymerase-3 subunit epsilon